jgi:hypothetical protein
VFFIDFLLAIAIALAFSILFVLVMGRRRGPGRSGPLPFVWLFVILLMTAWAGGLWIGPIGPVVFGVAWMPFLIAALVVALVIAAATELGRRGGAEAEASRADVRATTLAFGVVTWALLAALVVVVLVAYLR